MIRACKRGRWLALCWSRRRKRATREESSERGIKYQGSSTRVRGRKCGHGVGETEPRERSAAPFVQREFTCRKRRSTRPALRLSACAAVIFNPDTYVNTGASRPRQDATHLCQTNRIKCYIRKTPAFVSGIGALAAVAKASVSVARVSAGSMIPSSHSRAVAKYACDSPSYRCRIASWYLSASA